MPLGTRSVLISTDPDKGRALEVDLYVCNHCRRIQHAPAASNHRLQTGVPEALGAICHGCNKMICLQCAAKRYCEPLEKWLDIVEAKAQRDAENLY
jgi:hypothetical protein